MRRPPRVLAINDKNMLMAPLSIQMGMVDRQIVVGVLDDLGVFLWPEPQGRQGAGAC